MVSKNTDRYRLYLIFSREMPRSSLRTLCPAVLTSGTCGGSSKDFLITVFHVREYVHELEGIFLVVGPLTPQEKVSKLWKGLSTYLQKGLWREKLTPTTATWDEVVETAEILEIAERAGERVGRRSGGSSNSRGGGNGGNGNGGHGGGGGGGGGNPPPSSGSGNRFGGGKNNQNRSGNNRPSGSGSRSSGSRFSGNSNSNVPKNKSASQVPRLSDKERNDLLAANKCFVCKEVGHMARSCPKAQRVKSDRKGKAPGISTFNIEVNSMDTENLRGLVGSTARIDEVSLNHVGLDPTFEFEESETESVTDDDLSSNEGESEIDELTYPDEVLYLPITCKEGRPKTRMGNLVEENAKRALEGGAPYWIRDYEPETENEFLVYEIEGDRYVIFHYLLDDDILVDDELLRDSEFDLVNWFRLAIEDQVETVYYPSDWGLANIGDPYAQGVERILNTALPWPDSPVVPPIEATGQRFCCKTVDGLVEVHDTYLQLTIHICVEVLERLANKFDLVNYYAVTARRLLGEFTHIPHTEEACFKFNTWLHFSEREQQQLLALSQRRPVTLMNVNIPHDTIPAIQRNAGTPRDFRRMIPEPVIVVVLINGQPARALLDTGSLADFMSAKLAQQLKLPIVELAKPLPVHLAVQGSRAKVNLGCTAELSYQSIKGKRYFDIINLLNYDLILGTPFLFQHQISIGFHPTTVTVGSSQALPLEGKQLRTLESRSAEIYEDRLEEARNHLREYAAPICKDASDSPLPPLRAINHTIPLKDPTKTYSWRPSKCPDAHRASWVEKRDAYLKSGRWKMTTARNASPMLLLTKPGTG
ncbi:hypothetical protein K474DRAFT_1750949, partial [Panus rudis PR-1116 ss-1]